MLEDAKLLLRMVCIPYVVSPAEAEAQQCAAGCCGPSRWSSDRRQRHALFAEEIAVYKNVFDEKQYVERYQSRDIKRELAGSHAHISFAWRCSWVRRLHAGCTWGGHRQCTEILAAFPGADGLGDFRKMWIYSNEPAVRPAAEPQWRRYLGAPPRMASSTTPKYPWLLGGPSGFRSLNCGCVPAPNYRRQHDTVFMGPTRFESPLLFLP